MATLTAPTLGKLIFEVRGLLRSPNEANSAWSNVDLTTYLNEGVRRYFTEVVNVGEGQFTTAVNLNITTDTETVALPADCFRVRELYRAVSGGFTPLHYRNNLGEGYSTQGGSGSGYIPLYHFRGNSIVLRPTPNFTETAGLRLEYVQFPETLLNAADTMTTQVPPVFRDLVIAYGVYKAKVTESLVSGTVTYGAAKAVLDDLYMAFKEALPKRSDAPTYIQPFNPEE